MISIKTNIGLHSHISITLIFNALTKFYKQQKTKFKLKALFSQSNQRLLVYSRRKRFSKKGNLHVRNRAYSKNTMKYFAVCTPYLSYTTMLITSVESLSLEPRLDTAKSLSSSCKIIFHYYLGLTYFLCQ